MTDFRSQDQITADFRRLDPQFSQITRRNQLLGYLTDHQLDETTAAATGAGPVLFNLGVLDGPEWVGVRAFLDNRQLVSQPARAEFRQLETDLKAADADHDGFVNNQEMVTFVARHTDRWANVAIFRTAANSYLNRLPAYIAQPNLTEQQVSRLWGIMNHFAEQWNAAGAATANRGTIYGLSLQGFPSSDRANSPDLIRRAMAGQLTPEELASVHQVLQVQRNAEGRYVFEGGAPLNPEEIGRLGVLLEGAARAGRAFQGMTLLTGDQERQFFTVRNQVIARFRQELQESQGNRAAMRVAFERITTEMTRLEADHPEQISTTTLVLRAYMGDLNPAEASSLRTWMQGEAQTQGVSCSGPLDCMRMGFMRFFQGIARDPWHFIAHNGAFIGGAMLYRRFVLRNAFERGLSAACGGNVANPRQAYRDYEKFLKDQLSQRSLLRRLPQNFLQNPYVGLAIFNFGIAPAMNGVWDSVTGTRNHPVLDFATDGIGILAFEAFETYNAFFNRSGLQNFAQANPGACRKTGQEEAAPATAPAPETETQQATSLSNDAIRSMSQEQVLEYVRRPYGQWTEAQFGEAMNGNAPALTPLQVSQLPEGLRPLFDADLHWGAAAEPQVQQLRSVTPRIGDLLANHYAQTNPELATQIREDVLQITNVMQPPLNAPEAEVAASVRWALRQYITNLQDGGIVRASYFRPMIQEGGLARTYMAIRASQECSFGCIGETMTFEQGARSHYRSRSTSLYNSLHPETWPTSSANAEGSARSDYMLRNSQGQPMIFLPIPCSLGLGSAASLPAFIRSLFGAGAAAGESAPAFGWGAAAFAGGA